MAGWDAGPNSDLSSALNLKITRDGQEQPLNNIPLEQLMQLLKNECLISFRNDVIKPAGSQQHKISEDFAVILIRDQLPTFSENKAKKLANHLNLLLIPIQQAIAWLINNNSKPTNNNKGSSNYIGRVELDKYLKEYIRTYALDLQMNGKFNNLNEDYKIMLTTWKVNEKLIESMGKEFAGNVFNLLGILSLSNEQIPIEILKKFDIGFIEQNLSLLEKFNLVQLNQKNPGDFNSTVITMKKGIKDYIWFNMDLTKPVQSVTYFIGQHLPLSGLTTEYRSQIFHIVLACVENDPAFMIKSGCLLKFFNDASMFYENSAKNLQQFEETQSLLKTTKFIKEKLTHGLSGLPEDESEGQRIFQEVIATLENFGKKI